MSTIRYLPSEIQARFKAWADARGQYSEEISRDDLWAAYIDARDGLHPGTTLDLMKRRESGLEVSPPKRFVGGHVSEVGAQMRAAGRQENP